MQHSDAFTASNRVVRALRGRFIEIAVFCLGVVLSAAGCTPPSSTQSDYVASGDYPVYADLNGAINRATHIVLVQYLSSKNDLLYPDIPDSDDVKLNPQAGLTLTQAELDAMAVPITLTQVRVIETLKGDLTPGTVISVSQPRGTANWSSSTRFSSNGEFVLFLEMFSADRGSPISPSWILTMHDGELTALSTSAGSASSGALPHTIDDIRKALTELEYS